MTREDGMMVTSVKANNGLNVATDEDELMDLGQTRSFGDYNRETPFHDTSSSSEELVRVEIKSSH